MICVRMFAWAVAAALAVTPLAAQEGPRHDHAGRADMPAGCPMMAMATMMEGRTMEGPMMILHHAAELELSEDQRQRIEAIGMELQEASQRAASSAADVLSRTQRESLDSLRERGHTKQPHPMRGRSLAAAHHGGSHGQARGGGGHDHAHEGNGHGPGCPMMQGDRSPEHGSIR